MDQWLAVGLGNPGARYAANRHNVGAHVIDALAERHRVTLAKHKGSATAAKITVGGAPVLIAIPTTFMNVSGEPVRDLARFYKIPPARVIVVHDELDIEFGLVRLKLGGGEGVVGHARLPPGSRGGRAAAGADGPRRLCAARLQRRGEARDRRLGGGGCRCGGRPRDRRPAGRAATLSRTRGHPMSLAGLLQALAADDGIASAVRTLRAADARIEVAVPVGLRAPLVVLAGPAEATTLVVTATAREAEDLAAAIGSFLPPDAVATFPSWETLPHERVASARAPGCGGPGAGPAAGRDLLGARPAPAHRARARRPCPRGPLRRRRAPPR